ncbi:hypothetical protein ACFLWC_04510 [Chloroflexota bacterium]
MVIEWFWLRKLILLILIIPSLLVFLIFRKHIAAHDRKTDANEYYKELGINQLIV